MKNTVELSLNVEDCFLICGALGLIGDLFPDNTDAQRMLVICNAVKEEIKEDQLSFYFASCETQ